MGKKKDKSGADKGDGRKAKRIPKEIGGFAVPKELRQAGETLLAKAATPEGKAAIATGLGLMATMAAAAVEKKRARVEPKPANDPHGNAGAGGGAEALGEAVGNVVDAVMSRMFGGKRPG